MKKLQIILFLSFLFLKVAQAQNSKKYPVFIPSYDRFSKNKIAYLTLRDGSKIEGEIDQLARKKGLIEEIKIMPTGEKKKQTIDPVLLENAYLAPTSLSKLATFSNEITKIQRVGRYDVNNDLIEKGYVYFESSLAQVKKKEEYVILQLLNPTFSGRIRVYDDPLAMESMSLNMGGMTLAGGDSKSYYIKKDDQKAYKLKRADFLEDFPKIFGDCPSVIKSIEKEAKWLELSKYVFIYNEECSK